MDADRFSREPVSTYGEALSWLFTHSDVAEWAFDPDHHFPREASLICAIFGVNPEQLIKDLRKLWNQACAPAPIRRADYRRRGGW